MKRIIQNKMYDTKTATKLASWSNGHYPSDFEHMSQTLYRSPMGQLFIAGEGGPMSGYAREYGTLRTGGSNIELVNDKEAVEWLADHELHDKLEELFPGHIEVG